MPTDDELEEPPEDDAGSGPPELVESVAGVGLRRWAKDAASAPAPEKPKASEFEFTPAGEWLRISFMLAIAIGLPLALPREDEVGLLAATYAVMILGGFAFQLAPRRGWGRELAAATTVVAMAFAVCGWSLGCDFLWSLRAGGLPEEVWLAACRRVSGQVLFLNNPDFVHLPVLLVAGFGGELVIREGVSERGGEAPLWGLLIPLVGLQVIWFLLLPGQAGPAEWIGFLVLTALISSGGLLAGVLGGVLCACIFHGLVHRVSVFRSAE
jgi:hypothetical protein